jgi:hypothetical protein
MPTDPGSTRIRIAFSADAWYALDYLAKDSIKAIQELADEAFRDLLKRYGRPVTVRDILRVAALLDAALRLEDRKPHVVPSRAADRIVPS